MFIDKNILYAIFKIENVFINIYFIGGVLKIKKYVSLFIFLLVLLIPIQVFAEYQQFVRRSDNFKVGQYGQLIHGEIMQLKTIMDIASQWFQENTKKRIINYTFTLQ